MIESESGSLDAAARAAVIGGVVSLSSQKAHSRFGEGSVRFLQRQMGVKEDIMISVQNVSGNDGGRCLKLWGSAGLLLALMVVPLFSQTERGNITGQVRDSTGSVVPGAQVVATQLSTRSEQPRVGKEGRS